MFNRINKVMQEKLVLLETAKLAKEKEFDLELDVIWGKNQQGGWQIWNDINGYFVDLEHYQAPTQSLLQKWLREVYKIRIYITQKVAGDFGFEIYIPNSNKEKIAGKPWERVSYFTQHYSTYEEALEAGLQEALKLIKNE